MDSETLQNLYDLGGQTAVVTGGTGVLGGELAAALAGLGANVGVLARRPVPPERLLQQLEGAAGREAVIQADMLDRAALEVAAQAIRARLAGCRG